MKDILDSLSHYASLLSFVPAWLGAAAASAGSQDGTKVAAFTLRLDILLFMSSSAMVVSFCGLGPSGSITTIGVNPNSSPDAGLSRLLGRLSAVVNPTSPRDPGQATQKIPWGEEIWQYLLIELSRMLQLVKKTEKRAEHVVQTAGGTNMSARL